MTGEKVRSEVGVILVIALGLIGAELIGSWIFSPWIISTLILAGSSWIAYRSWLLGDWVTDISVRRVAREPLSQPVSFSAPKNEPIKIEPPKNDSSTVTKILLSSENTAFREKMALILSKSVEKNLHQKVEVLCASSARETLALAIDHVFHLVILDSTYSGDLGFSDLHTEIKRLDKTIPVILLTDKDVSPIQGIEGFYKFPFDKETLDRVLAHLRPVAAKVRHSGNNLRHF